MDQQPDCKYNSQLICEPADRRCAKCGWNPKVMNERLEKFYAGTKKEEKE